jgi:2-oxoglutarate dehydrogenase E2 component (dihydrolipoamide succinyltransferase)
VVELETEKVNLEVGADTPGVLASIERQEGEDVQIGDVLGIVEEAEEPPQETAEPPAEAPQEAKAEGPEARKEVPEERERMPEKPQEAKTPDSGEQKRATPVARRLAQEQEIDLAQVPTSHPGSRVTKEDVQGFMERRQTAREAGPSLPSDGRPKQEERLRMSRRRRTIARRLVEAQQTAAMLTTFNEIDMGAVMELRQRRKASFQERHEVKLGIVSFFVKASIGALKAFPELNAEIQNDEIVLKRYYDIGVAIGASEGLVVPVLRDADRMSFAQIERAIKTYAQKADEGSLSLEDLEGGTFTITNGGVFGSLLSTPILNPPEVGILGLHKIEDRPVVLDGQVTTRPMMYVALSYDHRIVDGREAVQFLVRVKELIEDPETLLLEG